MKLLVPKVPASESTLVAAEGSRAVEMTGGLGRGGLQCDTRREEEHQAKRTFCSLSALLACHGWKFNAEPPDSFLTKYLTLEEYPVLIVVEYISRQGDGQMDSNRDSRCINGDDPDRVKR